MFQKLSGRRGAVMVTTAMLMTVIVGFVALSVDMGMVALTKTRMQNAVDAAALAAAQEITIAVQQAGANGGSGNVSAEQQVRTMAANMATKNGVYVNPSEDVLFGKRYYDENSKTWEIAWGSSPYNAVKVSARRTEEDTSAQDGRLKMSFAWVLGIKSTEVVAEATAFVEARDIVSVLDFSGSMNDDSDLTAVSKFGLSSVLANQQDIYNALNINDGSLTFTPQYLKQTGSGNSSSLTATFKNKTVDLSCNKTINTVRLGFSDNSSKTYYSVNSKNKSFSYNNKTIDEVWAKTNGGSTWIKLYDTASNVKSYFGLKNVSWPYDSGSWDGFISHCRSNSVVKDAGYERMYGGACLVDYLLRNYETYSECNKLWKTPHYPFHAMKEGMTLFTNFLNDLNFGDKLGLVSYATSAKWETSVSESDDNTYIDVTSAPMTSEYSDINAIQVHRQAGHWTTSTNIGDGILKARDMLDQHKRLGASPVIFLMTDGLANVKPSGWSLPSGWKWSDLTDFDGNGSADYTTSDSSKQYAFYQAKLAIDEGITIHTLSVGAGADHEFMEAIAKASGGTHIAVDLGSGYSLEALESQVEAAYNLIAGKVPPPKLVNAD